MKRIVIIQADARAVSGGLRAPLSVGVARWRGLGIGLALVVKATFRFSHGGAEVTAELTEPEPVCAERSGETEEVKLRYPTDFVLSKPRCDMAVIGHAHAIEPAERIEAALRIGAFERRFAAVSPGQPLAAIPLRPPHLIELWRAAANQPDDEDSRPDDGTASLLAPLRAARETVDDELLDFDFSQLQAAPPAMQTQAIAADASIFLQGLSARAAERLITLPALLPRAFVECTGHTLLELPLRCDTLVLDTDFERLTLVWRARLPPDVDDDDIDRVMVALDPTSGKTSPEALMGGMPRGTVGFAIEEDPQIEGDPDELEMARYEVLEHCAEPELALATYAAICAELTEARSRDEVLAAHDQDERSWTIEERAWTEKMGNRADRGDGTLTYQFAELFASAQAALAGPDEPRPLEAYAEIKRQYVRSTTPTDVLAAATMSLGEWMRLDRHWQQCAAAEPATAARLATLLSKTQ